MTEQRPVRRPAPPPGPETPQPFKLGEAPLARRAAYMPDRVTKQLKQLGWADGDPVPSDLGARLREMQEELRASQPADFQDNPPEGYTGPVKDESVDISRLPPEKQQELRMVLARAKTQAAMAADELGATVAQRRATPPPPPAAPSAFVQSVQAEEARRAGVAPTPRRSVVKAPPPPPPPPIAQPVAPEPAEPEPAAPEPGPDLVTGAATTPAVCPRCLYDCRQPLLVEPDEDDKLQFQLSFHGRRRFVRHYPLFGDQGHVEFRSLTTRESFAVDDAVRRRVQAGEIMSAAALALWTEEYRLLASLAELRLGGETTPLLPLEEYEHDADGYRDAVYADVLVSEQLRIALRTPFRDFEERRGKLVAMVQSPDFWDGIGSRG